MYLYGPDRPYPPPTRINGMPKKAHVSTERQLHLDAFKASQKDKKKERLGFLDQGMLRAPNCSTQPRRVQELGVAHMVNAKSGGDSRPGGAIVEFHQ
jgi:hypothetical protein